MNLVSKNKFHLEIDENKNEQDDDFNLIKILFYSETSVTRVEKLMIVLRFMIVLMILRNMRQLKFLMIILKLIKFFTKKLR
jgi:hypothetical protein